MQIKIYGKPNCSYCSYAKNLLDNKNIEYEYESVETPEQVDALRENVSQTIRTVPVVLIDGQWIGGYEELREYVKNNITFTEDGYKQKLFE